MTKKESSPRKREAKKQENCRFHPDKKAVAHGLCSGCYKKWHHDGKPPLDTWSPDNRPTGRLVYTSREKLRQLVCGSCTKQDEDCSQELYRRHYQMWYRDGQPEGWSPDNRPPRSKKRGRKK